MDIITSRSCIFCIPITACQSYLWWDTALLLRTTAVKKAKDKLWTDWDARAKPAHSVISPKKLAPDTYSNIPPVERKVHREIVLKPNQILQINTKPSEYWHFPLSPNVIKKKKKNPWNSLPSDHKWPRTHYLTAGHASSSAATLPCENGRFLAEKIPDVPWSSFGVTQLTASTLLDFSTLFSFRVWSGLFERFTASSSLQYCCCDWVLGGGGGEPLSVGNCLDFRFT